MNQAKGRMGGPLRSWVDRVEYEALHGAELRRRVEALEADLVQLDELLDDIEERHERGVANRMFPSAEEQRERAIAHGRRERILAELTERRPVLEEEEESAHTSNEESGSSPSPSEDGAGADEVREAVAPGDAGDGREDRATPGEHDETG